MTEPFDEWRKKLDQIDLKFTAGVKGASEDWQAVALAIIRECDGEIGRLLAIRYGMHWAVVLEDVELYQIILHRVGQAIEPIIHSPGFRK